MRSGEGLVSSRGATVRVRRSRNETAWSIDSLVASQHACDVRVGIRCVVVVSVVLFLGMAAMRPATGAPSGGGPFASPLPGSPVFVSFANVFEDSLSSTIFDIKATGSDLEYVWSLQNVDCGSLSLPQGRDERNAYVHPSCALQGEVKVRVTVLVAKKTDLSPNGTPSAA